MAVHTCGCGAELRRLAFGIPDARDVSAGLLDEIVLGGCMVRGGGADPNLACPACDRRYVSLSGHLFGEEHWLAPVAVTSEAPGALRVTLIDEEGKEVLLVVTSENHALAHFEKFV